MGLATQIQFEGMRHLEALGRRFSSTKPSHRMDDSVRTMWLVLPCAMTLRTLRGTDHLTPIRRIVADLKASFAAGGIEAMSRTHSAAMKNSLSYRLFCGLVDLVFPATSLLDIAKDLDRQVGELGVAGGSKAVLNGLPTPWLAEFPGRGEDEIKTCPVVVFGRHGSVLTPFLVAASLDRPDLKVLGASYVAKLGPNIARSMYPVLLPMPTFRSAGRTGILPRISGWLTSRLESPVDKDVARARNRTSLSQAAEHVRSGGALLIAPDARDPKVNWRPGIGLLVAHLALIDAGNRDVYLVPFRIWASITGVFRLLSRNPISRALGRWQYRRPIRVVFADPIPLSVVIEQSGLDPAAITEYLETHYRGLGF